jgi:hypothetical protein
MTMVMHLSGQVSDQADWSAISLSPVSVLPLLYVSTAFGRHSRS